MNSKKKTNQCEEIISFKEAFEEEAYAGSKY